MTQEVSPNGGLEKCFSTSFDLIAGTSESTRAKTAENIPRALGSAGAQSRYAKRLSGGMALIFGVLFGQRQLEA